MPKTPMTTSEVRALKRNLAKVPLAELDRWRERAKLTTHDLTTQCRGCGDVRDWFEAWEMMLHCEKCGSYSLEVLVKDGESP